MGVVSLPAVKSSIYDGQASIEPGRIMHETECRNMAVYTHETRGVRTGVMTRGGNANAEPKYLARDGED